MNDPDPSDQLPTPPKLRLRRLPIGTYHEAVAYLPRLSTACRPEEFQVLAKVEIRTDGRRIAAVMNVIDHSEILAPDEVGLSQQAFDRLGAPEGDCGRGAPGCPARKPGSGLSQDQGRGAVAGRDRQDHPRHSGDAHSKMEIAAFLVSCASFFSTGEVLALTRAMAAVGSSLGWPDGLVVDKHCIGGIPGNRTSMIVAAHGLLIPKTSSRAITSPAGTPARICGGDRPLSPPVRAPGAAA